MHCKLYTSSYSEKFPYKSGRLLMMERKSASVQIYSKNASLVALCDITEQNALIEAPEQSEMKNKILIQNSQDQLQLSEEKYRTVINNAADGIMIIQQGYVI